jgi:hypothetical protein
MQSILSEFNKKRVLEKCGLHTIHREEQSDGMSFDIQEL